MGIVGLPSGLPTAVIGSPIAGGRVVFTNVGLSLMATALQTPGANAGISYVAIGLGAGTLSTALTSGNPYTSLALAAPLVGTIAVGQSLTLFDSLGDTQAVISTGANPGATSIGVNSFIAGANFGVGTGVVNTPSVSDTRLQNEVARVGTTGGAPGSIPGESLNFAYFDPGALTNIYIEVGYYGGNTASLTLGSGILIARDVQYWNHTQNVDSAGFQLDSIL
jgi:hypothetical protein